MCDSFIISYLTSKEASQISRGISIVEEKLSNSNQFQAEDAVQIFPLLIPLLMHIHYKVRKNAFYLFLSILNRFSDYLDSTSDSVPNCIASLICVDEEIAECAHQALEFIFDLDDPKYWWPYCEKTLFNSKSNPQRIKLMFIIYSHFDEIPVLPIIKLLDDPIFTIQKMAYSMLQFNDQEKIQDKLDKYRTILGIDTNPYELDLNQKQMERYLQMQENIKRQKSQENPARTVRRTRRTRAPENLVETRRQAAEETIQDEMYLQGEKAMQSANDHKVHSRFVTKMENSSPVGKRPKGSYTSYDNYQLSPNLTLNPQFNLDPNPNLIQSPFNDQNEMDNQDFAYENNNNYYGSNQQNFNDNYNSNNRKNNQQFQSFNQTPNRNGYENNSNFNSNSKLRNSVSPNNQNRTPQQMGRPYASPGQSQGQNYSSPGRENQDRRYPIPAPMNSQQRNNSNNNSNGLFDRSNMNSNSNNQFNRSNANSVLSSRSNNMANGGYDNNPNNGGLFSRSGNNANNNPANNSLFNRSGNNANNNQNNNGGLFNRANNNRNNDSRSNASSMNNMNNRFMDNQSNRSSNMNNRNYGANMNNMFSDNQSNRSSNMNNMNNRFMDNQNSRGSNMMNNRYSNDPNNRNYMNNMGNQFNDNQNFRNSSNMNNMNNMNNRFNGNQNNRSNTMNNMNNRFNENPNFRNSSNMNNMNNRFNDNQNYRGGNMNNMNNRNNNYYGENNMDGELAANDGTFDQMYPINQNSNALFDKDSLYDGILQQLGNTINTNNSPNRRTKQSYTSGNSNQTIGNGSPSPSGEPLPFELVDLKDKNWEYRRDYLEKIHKTLSSNKKHYNYRHDYLMDCVMDAANPPNKRVAIELSKVITDVILEDPGVIEPFLDEITSFMVQSVSQFNSIYQVPSSPKTTKSANASAMSSSMNTPRSTKSGIASSPAKTKTTNASTTSKSENKEAKSTKNEEDSDAASSKMSTASKSTTPSKTSKVFNIPTSPSKTAKVVLVSKTPSSARSCKSTASTKKSQTKVNTRILELSNTLPKSETGYDISAFDKLIDAIILEVNPAKLINSMLDYPNRTAAHVELLIKKLYTRRPNLTLCLNDLEKLLTFLVLDAYPLALKLGTIGGEKSQPAYLDAVIFILHKTAKNQPKFYESIISLSSHAGMIEILSKFLPEETKIQPFTLSQSQQDKEFTKSGTQNRGSNYNTYNNGNEYDYDTPPMFIVLRELKKSDDCAIDLLADSFDNVDFNSPKHLLKVFLRFLSLLSRLSEKKIKENDSDLKRICFSHFNFTDLLSILSLRNVESEILIGLSKYIWFAPKDILKNGDVYYENMYKLFTKSDSGQVRNAIIIIASGIQKATGKSILDVSTIAEPHQKVIEKLLAQYENQDQK